jgi:hypothetical protein
MTDEKAKRLIDITKPLPEIAEEISIFEKSNGDVRSGKVPDPKNSMKGAALIYVDLEKEWAPTNLYVSSNPEVLMALAAQLHRAEKMIWEELKKILGPAGGSLLTLALETMDVEELADGIFSADIQEDAGETSNRPSGAGKILWGED